MIRRTFGEIDGALRLHVLDSTDPGAVLALERRLELERALFVVSSKSGGTIETLSHFRYFHARMRELVGSRAGSHFVAITDPGSPCRRSRWSTTSAACQNAPDIGGRYPVLSYFGLVPAALMGVPVEALLQSCQVAEQNCTNYDQTASNSGLWMGLVMGELALRGRDKLTLCVSEPISSFGLWVEQLIARAGQGREGDSPGCGGAARTAGGVSAPTGSSPTCETPTSRTPRWTGRWRRLRRPGTRRSPLRFAGGLTWAGSSSSPSSRRRSPAGCSASTSSTSRTCRRQRTTPAGCWTATRRTARCPTWPTPTTPPGRVAAYRRAAALRRDHGHVEPSPAFDQAIVELRVTIGTVPARPPHSATARGSCTPPDSCTGRTANRPLSPVGARRRRGPGEPGCRLQLRDAQERAGDRGPGDASRPRPGRGAVRLRGDPAVAVHDLTDRIRSLI